MLIGKFRHRGLKALYENDDASGVSTSSAAKIKRILAALEFADDISQLNTPGWKVHPLKGSRSGVYSITVTANWRITFRLEGNRVTDINYEDYH
jgi:proteic killer suppression protein